MFTAQKVYQMLGNESLWNVAERCDALLTASKIPYSICGSFATQCGAVTLVLATTVNGIDGEEYTVKAAYTLSGSTVSYGGDTERIATWRAGELLP